jgi:L-threonylcarbamoyladenylate synthase
MQILQRGETAMPEVNAEKLRAAAGILRAGGIVAFATETVYGLGGDATNAQAIERIYQAKGRPPTNPLIVHVSDESMAREFTTEWPPAAQELSRAFWPGPLTIVLPRSPRIVPQVSAGLQTIGVRAPNHPVAQALLRAFGGPIAAPSANRSNRISPTTADHVRSELGDAVDLILDGGPCQIGIESTVVDLCGAHPQILRPGSITLSQIARVIGNTATAPDPIPSSQPATSPGQQLVHYAPLTPAFSFEGSQAVDVAHWCQNHPDAAAAILLIEGSPSEGVILAQSSVAHHLVHAPGNAPEYARALYATLRELDAGGFCRLWIEMPQDQVAWTAVRDRLLRATKSHANRPFGEKN